jgi:hypothetical protein
MAFVIALFLQEIFEIGTCRLKGRSIHHHHDHHLQNKEASQRYTPKVVYPFVKPLLTLKKNYPKTGDVSISKTFTGGKFISCII